MKRYTNQGSLRAIGTLALAANLAMCAMPLALAQSQTRLATLESGTVLPAKLDEKLSSKDSKVGDTFTATVREEGEEYYGRLPKGTRLEGVVRVAKPQRDDTPGMLELSFQRLRTPNGRSIPIEGTLIGLDNKSVDRTEDGRLVAKKKSGTDRLTYVGYGAGAGLLVSLFTKRTFQDTLLGAGLGYLFGSLQKSRGAPTDVTLKPGTELGVRLDRSVNLSGSYSDSDEADLGADSERLYRKTKESQARDADERDSEENRPKKAATIGVLLDDKNIEFDSTARPFLSNNVVMIPVRPVLNAVKVKFDYNASEQRLTADYNDDTIRASVGSRIVVINGTERVRMEAPVQRVNGTVYVPMKFLALATGKHISWDAGSQTVILSDE